MHVAHGLSFTKQVESAQSLPPERIDAGPVLLRRIAEDDAAAIAEAVLASMKHLEPWMPWATPEAADVGNQRARIIAAEGMWDAGTDFIYSVLLRGALVSAVGRQADGRDQTGDIPRRSPVAELADGVRAADGAAESGRGVPGRHRARRHVRVAPADWAWRHRDGLLDPCRPCRARLRLGRRTSANCGRARPSQASNGLRSTAMSPTRRAPPLPRRLGYRLDRIEDREPKAPAETGRHMIWVLAPRPDLDTGR